MKKTQLTTPRCQELRNRMAAGIIGIYRQLGQTVSSKIHVYGVPRGGIPVAYLMEGYDPIGGQFITVDDPKNADVFVDDIIDSGATAERYVREYGRPFFALVDKRSDEWADAGWISFPWERADDGADEDIEANVTRILQFIGEDPNRGGLTETPARVARAWSFWTCGYSMDPADVLKTFEDGAENYDEMVVVQDIPFYSHCEHHMAPFFGTATIGYIPNKKIVGLSKLSRLLQVFAQRLQVQERLTNQVVDALMEHLDPVGAGCIIKARHLCMESRGVQQQGHHTVTSAVRGAMKEQPETRAEFLGFSK